MTMDFVNADVTNILRLIAEVSKLNIVWGPQVKGSVSMRLKDVPWDQALDIVLANNKLGKKQVGNVIWITTKAEMAQIEAEERQKREEEAARKRKEEEERLAQQKREPKKTDYITINFKDVGNIKTIIDDTIKSAEGKLTLDSQTKTIIMWDTISKIEAAKALVKRLDRPTPQVMIEARIVEATTSFSRNLGVRWDYDLQRRNRTDVPWNGTPAWATQNVEANYPEGGNLYQPTFQTNVPTGWTSNLGLLFHKLGSFGFYGNTINAQIALSESKGEVNVMSAPKIVTRDTVTATIKQGSKIVIPSGTDANGNATFEQVDASLKLEVTPTITPNNMVIMKVDVSDDFPDYANARLDQVPIATKNAATTMMVKSGDTVVIGGIFKESKSENVEGIPLLSKIPLFGWLFKAQTKTSEKRELLIFLTPSVLPSVI
jgi:type IV pilus assembly protein PilQ